MARLKMTTYTILGILAWVLIVMAACISSWNLRRFSGGDFKDVVRTLLVAEWFIALPYGLFVVKDLLGFGGGATPEELGWAIHGCMAIVGVYFLKTAVLFQGFSKTYGFARGK